MRNGFVHFQFLENNQAIHPNTKFYLKPAASLSDIPFFDEENDCIVLEIMPCQDEATFPIPEPFTVFSSYVSEFYLIGHTGGYGKDFDHVTYIADPSDHIIKDDIAFMKTESLEIMRNNGIDQNRFHFESGEYDYALNEKRILFHCNSSKGASGAPGIQVKDGHIVVVTMLLHGYPDWYYDSCQELSQLKQHWPMNYCIEQGALMREIYLKMVAKNTELCREVFQNQ